MFVRPPVIRDQDKIEVRLTSEAEYRIPFTFIEALNEGTLFDRPEHAFLDVARERRSFHVLNRTTDNIIGTGIIQGSGDEKSTMQAEVGGLMFHPAARGFGLCSLLVKIMMVYAVRESGRDSPNEGISPMSSTATAPHCMHCSRPASSQSDLSMCTGGTSTR